VIGIDQRRASRDVLMNHLIGSPLVLPGLRWRLLRMLGLTVERSRIQSGCWFGGRKVTIGRDAFVNHGVVFDNLADITIGAGARVGLQVMLCTSTHEPGDRQQRAGLTVGRPIVIGPGVWIGTRAVILPGVTVGEGCVIAAGAVVTRNCEPSGTYAGVPAKRVSDLP
jgi:maltose O-acetyltransferase